MGCDAGSRDGFTAEDFHRLCDNQGPTLTVVQSDQGCIFGGYLSLPWSSVGGWKGDLQAWVFSLKNSYNVIGKFSPRAASTYAVTRNATFHHPRYGPAFGWSDIRKLLCPLAFSSVYQIFSCDIFSWVLGIWNSNSNTNGYVENTTFAAPTEHPHSFNDGKYAFKVTEIEVFVMSDM